MKALDQPRAVLVLRDEPSFGTFRDVLKTVGIEGYQALDLDVAVQRALRLDTMLVVIDARPFTPDAVGRAITQIRKDHKSHDVLLVVVAAPGQATHLEQLGADVVQGSPVSPEVAYTTLIRLVKRPRPDTEPPPRGSETPDHPLDVLRRGVERRLAKHKIYLGASPGVGKTYAMLREAHELAIRGEDVVVGIVETHGRAETATQVDGLEVILRQLIDYKGTGLEEMDVNAILARRPATVLVDELAHTNVPGSVNKKRYEDVNVLLLAGIPVISTMNIQHLESLNTIVERLTGVKVRETVPDTILDDADEVILVDISPEALQRRLKAGKIYAPDKITQSLSNFFTTHNLTALRELVLRELADKVDERLEAVRATIGKSAQPTGISDRLLICVTPTASAQRLIRRGARLADRLNAELIVLHVEDRPLGEDARKMLDQNLELAASFEAEIVELRNPEVAEAIARYASQNRVTMIVLGETHKSRWSLIFQKSLFGQILDKTSNIDVVTVATHVDQNGHEAPGKG